MKKLLITLLIACANLVAYGQLSYEDFYDNRIFSYYGTTYLLSNHVYRFWDYVREKGTHVRLESVTNEKFEHLGVYTNGSVAQDLDEIRGIIKYARDNRQVLYHAMRNVFTLEELEANPNTMIIFNMVIDNQGYILETSVGFPVKGSYVIQPQQIAALETMIRKNLTFVLDTERAAKFNYFQSETWLFFRDFINEPTLPDGVQFVGGISQAANSLYTIRLVEDFNYFGEFESSSSPSPITGLNTGDLVP